MLNALPCLRSKSATCPHRPTRPLLRLCAQLLASLRDDALSCSSSDHSTDPRIPNTCPSASIAAPCGSTAQFPNTTARPMAMQHCTPNGNSTMNQTTTTLWADIRIGQRRKYYHNMSFVLPCLTGCPELYQTIDASSGTTAQRSVTTRSWSCSRDGDWHNICHYQWVGRASPWQLMTVAVVLGVKWQMSSNLPT